MRPPRKSREPGLFKECQHLSWDRCECLWLGWVKQHRRINLAKWAGAGKRNLTRSEAKNILVDVRAAILNNEFDPAGKKATGNASDGRTFAQLMKSYEEHVAKRRADGRLRSTSLDSSLKRLREEFKNEKLRVLEQSSRRFETWLDGLTFSTGPRGRQLTHKLSPASWNRYYEHGRHIFNWAIAQGYASANPFVKFSKRPERNKRATRIPPKLERALFAALPKLCRKRQRTEMHRRLIGAIDLGLRGGEMLKVKVKHVDLNRWRITLPPENTKGGASTDRPEIVYAMTPRVQEMLKERASLGDDKFVFGSESGAYVASFKRSWRQLFKLAGLPVGRKSGLIWHDLRHEFVSHLVDEGGEIHEVKEAARHKDIRTTERYMTATEDRLKALMAKMANRGGA